MIINDTVYYKYTYITVPKPSDFPLNDHPIVFKDIDKTVDPIKGVRPEPSLFYSDKDGNIYVSVDLVEPDPEETLYYFVERETKK